MTISTGRYITFKSIYLEDTGQQFLCDFFRSADGDRYTVQVELAGQWIVTSAFKHGLSGWEQDDSMSELPGPLVQSLQQSIQLLEINA